MMFELTTQDAIAEIERELATRRGVYPKWVKLGKISREVAEHRVACLEVALRVLRKDAERG